MKVFGILIGIILTGILVWFIIDSVKTIVVKLRAKRKNKTTNTKDAVDNNEQPKN